MEYNLNSYIWVFKFKQSLDLYDRFAFTGLLDITNGDTVIEPKI